MSAASLKAAMDKTAGQDLNQSMVSTSTDSNWVPDEQVNECPLCNRKFDLFSVWKHHCRACGRIVCGSCSSNQIFVPAKGSKARVCDPCHDLSLVDKHSALTDKLGNSRQVEASLKTHLKEMTEQAKWFKDFLELITSEANAPGASFGGSTGVSSSSAAASIETPFSVEEDGAGDLASSFVTTNSELVTEEELMGAPQEATFSSPALSPRGKEEGILANLRDPKIATLIHRSRRRWKDTCSEIQASREENGRLEMDIEVLDRDYSECKAEMQQLYKTVKSMEGDTQNLPKRQVERDELKHNIEQLREELKGLNQRMATLEEGLPRSRPVSFFSNAGSEGGEARTCFGRGSEPREERRCARPGGCSVM